MTAARAAACAFTCLALTLGEGELRAQPRRAPGVAQKCATAYEEAQRLQAQARLLEARGEAAACAAIACPPEIVSYCGKLADEIEASVPSIVVAAIDASRRDQVATVSVDGAAMKPLDGRPLRLDPGLHRLRVATTAPPVRTAELEVTLRSGERNRRVEVVIPGGAAQAGPPERHGAPPFGYVPAAIAFGVAAVGLGVGATTGVVALSEDGELEEACNVESATCPATQADQVAATERLGYASTIGFAVGGAALAAGVVLAIVAASSRAPEGVEVGARGVRIRF